MKLEEVERKKRQRELEIEERERRREEERRLGDDPLSRKVSIDVILFVFSLILECESRLYLANPLLLSCLPRPCAFI